MPGRSNEETTRRRILMVGFCAVGGFEAVCTTTAAADDPAATRMPAVTKFTPDAVHYQPNPNDWQKCLFCTYFQAPATCSILSGTVTSEGWCTHFALLHE